MTQKDMKKPINGTLIKNYYQNIEDDEKEFYDMVNSTNQNNNPKNQNETSNNYLENQNLLEHDLITLEEEVSIIPKSYNFHMDLGSKFEMQGYFEAAVKQYCKASSFKKNDMKGVDSQEAIEALDGIVINHSAKLRNGVLQNAMLVRDNAIKDGKYIPSHNNK